MDVAQDLIQRVGINAMSFKHLSDQVGIRQPSVHHHFPRKADLINALLLRCDEELRSRFQHIAAGRESAAQKLHAVAEIYAEGVEEGRLCLLEMLSAEYASLSGETRRLLDRAIRNLILVIELILVQGIEAGELQSPADTFEAAYTFYSFLMGAHSLARCSLGVGALRTAVQGYVEMLKA